MDKNSLTGFLLIGAILIGFFILNKPSQEELAKQQAKQDSLAQVEAIKQTELAKLEQAKQGGFSNFEQDTAVLNKELHQRYGSFASNVTGEKKNYVLENSKVKITFSNKGGRITSVQLKEYLTHEKDPLILFNEEEMQFAFDFFTTDNRPVSTNDVYFNTDAAAVTSADESEQQITFYIQPEGKEKLQFTYTLAPDDYLAHLTIGAKGLQSVLPRFVNTLDLNYTLKMKQVERGADFERRYSGLYYKYKGDAVEHISGQKNSEKDLTTRLRWVGYKDQFFSSVLIADEHFNSAKIVQNKLEEEGYILHMQSLLSVPLSNNDIKMSFYFGPNHFKTLKKTGFSLEKLIYLGWVPVKYVNQWLVINVFNWLSSFISNYGVIILLLTVFIKLLVFPFTYGSYISTAKMRVLKPQIDEITKKYGEDKAMEKQQATMALYRKAGVNPLGGCLPMLFQFPFLIAMFYFFPSSIELRQQGFLWATDLASYDALISWEGDIPLISRFIGNHISLFTLLMTITNIISTVMNQEMAATTQQMKGMKTMMYMMPVMFFFVFNGYSAGLSFYYFVSTLITIGQTFFMRKLVNEDALLAKLEANKKKPVKKSKFQDRLEKMQKQQQTAARQTGKKR